MTKTEETYAAWLNILGSAPVEESEGAHDVNVLRIVATSTGDSERFSHAYMDVLLALAPQIKDTERVRDMVQSLIDASRAHRVQYIPGLPLVIDGVDCSPDAVRALKADRDHYRQAYMNGTVSL